MLLSEKQDKIQQVEEAIETLEAQIAECQETLDKMDIEDTSLADDDAYSDWIDEINGPVYIGSLAYCASRVLRELDPIAYRCGFSDYLDGLDITDSEEHMELTAQLDDMESDLTDLKDELDELNKESK